MAQLRTNEAEHLAECASEARKQAAMLPRGKVRDALLVKAEQYEARLQHRLDGDSGGRDGTLSRVAS